MDPQLFWWSYDYVGDLAEAGQLGAADAATTVTLLTGSMTVKQRRAALLRDYVATLKLAEPCPAETAGADAAQAAGEKIARDSSQA